VCVSRRAPDLAPPARRSVRHARLQTLGRRTPVPAHWRTDGFAPDHGFWRFGRRLNRRWRRQQRCPLGLQPGFRWTPSGGSVALNPLPGTDPSGAPNTSTTTAVSGDGSIAVGQGTDFASGDLNSQIVFWNSGGGIVSLGSLPGGAFSQAIGVSADGSTIVGSSEATPNCVTEAFRWTSGGGMVGLGFLTRFDASGQANGVSANGSVVVGSSGVAPQAFRWTSGSGMVGLGFLPGGMLSQANAISADGSTIIGWSGANLQFAAEAFRWTSVGGMVGLGFLPGTNVSLANAVSGNGSVWSVNRGSARCSLLYPG
jgi:probable HAF family extracellular repeat protein